MAVPSTGEEHAEQNWREPTLRKLALWAARTGLVMLAWMTYQALAQNVDYRTWGAVRMFAVLVIGTAWVAAGRFAYRTSVWVLVALLWLTGAYAGVLGITPGTALYFLAAPLVGGAYLGMRAGMRVAALSLAGLLLLAAWHVLFPDPRADLRFLDARDPLNWIRLILNICFLGSFLVVTAVSLLRQLESMLQERTRAHDALRAANEALRLEQSEKTRALEAELAAQRSLLTLQKREAFGQLAAGIAHDYNNQLLVILAWADRLRSPEPLSERTESLALEAICSAANQSAMLTRQLLVLGQGGVEMGGSCMPDQVIAADLQALRRLMPEDIELQFQAGDAPRVNMHESQLRQILLNLLLNARDAMQSGGLIRVSTGREQSETGELATVVVADTGVGIDAATQQRIFEPFFSTKGERGTGLGLSSVQLLVARAQGDIRVQSAPGTGSTFTVRLPGVPEPAHVEPTALTGVTAAAAHTVLVVEDDEQVREVVENALGEAGHTVLGTSGVTRALELLRRHRGSVDLLCVDAVLPAPGARFLIWEYRAAHPRGAVLVFSGYPEEALAQRGLSPDDFAVLSKPFTGAVLVQRVAEELVKQRVDKRERAAQAS